MSRLTDLFLERVAGRLSGDERLSLDELWKRIEAEGLGVASEAEHIAAINKVRATIDSPRVGDVMRALNGRGDAQIVMRLLGKLA